MSDDNSDDHNETQKKVVKKSVEDHEDRTVYKVKYDDRTSDTYTESKRHLAASRYSRLADFLINAQPGDTKPAEDNQGKTENKDTSLKKNDSD